MPNTIRQLKNNALDDRPLLDRLQARIKKYDSVVGGPLATDITLHEQSAAEITRLTAELEAAQKQLAGGAE
jgi:hypothetical protein